MGLRMSRRRRCKSQKAINPVGQRCSNEKKQILEIYNYLD